MDLWDSDGLNGLFTMSKETGRSAERKKRKELPIERGFPIERVNEIAEKEGRGVAKQYYRPIYTMHKWWARRLGCVFRTISIYSLIDDDAEIEVEDPGMNGNLTDYGGGTDVQEWAKNTDITNPETLWSLYTKDVRVKNKKILDPFMGGGTSIVESSRLGAKAVGSDLNPVAWFTSKKEIEAGSTNVDDLEDAFKNLEESIADELKSYYKTPCPNDGSHQADVMFYFWVKELDCVSCGTTVPLFDDYRVAKGRYENDDKYTVFCPDCNSITYVDDWRSESTCDSCSFNFVPEKGTSAGSKYNCPECGQKYGITDAIQEQGGFDYRLYALEYYCEHCDDAGLSTGEVKGYKAAEEADFELAKEASAEWEKRDDLRQYVPTTEIPKGSITESSAISGNDVFQHGYETWTDMFSDRQLLCLSKLLKEIEDIDDENIREFLLLTATDSLRGIGMMITYQLSSNAISSLFKTNSFDPPKRPAENNVWGAKKGARTFNKAYDRVKKGIEWANAPIERYQDESGSMVKSPPFNTPVGKNAEVYQRNVMELDTEDEYDAVITDPPYYDNIIYSDVSDYFYVWQRILLKEEYDCFQPTHTPKSESIVANPAENKGAEEFEQELGQAFSRILNALKEDGVLVFTYHHSDSESWGELLEALCDQGFEVTASYPVTSDLDKLTGEESVSFDIIIVARPAGDRVSISWNSLRRQIYRTAQQTRQRLEEDRNLSRGDIGVIEMGECFHEYSKHHGKVMRAGEEMTAKEVVNEIYGVIQEGSDIGVIDVFLDLLETPDASYNDLNKLTRGTDASPEQMEDLRLYRIDNGNFILGTWNDEKRLAYIQKHVNGENDNGLNALDKVQFLRYCYERGKSTQKYLEKWNIDDKLRELSEGLADATGDETYRRLLGEDTSLNDY